MGSVNGDHLRKVRSRCNNYKGVSQASSDSTQLPKQTQNPHLITTSDHFFLPPSRLMSRWNSESQSPVLAFPGRGIVGLVKALDTLDADCCDRFLRSAEKGPGLTGEETGVSLVLCCCEGFVSKRHNQGPSIRSLRTSSCNAALAVASSFGRRLDASLVVLRWLGPGPFL